MLADSKGPGPLAAEIKMTRMAHPGAFLVVEGKDDCRFWLPRRDRGCEVVDAEGKTNVMGAIERLDAESFRGALGVVDDDFDLVLGMERTSDNIVGMGTHDIEGLCIRSSALDGVLAEFADRKKLRQFRRAHGLDVRTALLERALVVGQVRCAALILGLRWDSKAIRVAEVVDKKSWTVDRGRLLRRAAAASEEGRVDEISSTVESLRTADPWMIASGKDMLAILRIGLMRVLGNLKTSVGVKDIARVLRASVPDEELRRTGLFAYICKWETANEPYLIMDAAR